MRTIEQELEEERTLRNAAVQAKKKAESDLNELESQIESAMKGKDEFARQLKKAHVSFYCILLTLYYIVINQHFCCVC